MRSLATELKSAVLQILVDTVGFNNLTDDDFDMVQVLGKYGDTRSNMPNAREILDKIVADRRKAVGATGPDMKREDWARTGPVGEPGPIGNPGIKGPVGTVGGPVGELLPTTAPTADEDEAKLPLAPADRGPEPQDVGTLLSTEAPPEIDPTDPPPDYTRLETAKQRRLDTDA